MSQHQYPYSAPMAAPRHNSTGHSTSSAFSSSANPDEDWTKISDLAERRRIQNRIAQRNYRKKLKRKLEELERRAGDGNPDTETPAQSPSKNKKQQGSHKARKSTAAPKMDQTGQHTPPTQHEELLFLPSYDDRGQSRTPPMFPCSSYPPPEAIPMSYGTAHSYSAANVAESYPAYMPTAVPVTLPSMTHFNDVVNKRDVYTTDETLSPYMNYPFVPGVDVSSPAHYETSNPQTPPLSHSFDHSANCSEAGYDYPATPLSMPGSPGLVQH